MTVVSGADLEFVDLPGRRAADPLREVEASSSLRIVELAKTHGRALHRHPRSEEVMYVAAGSGRVWIDEDSYPVSTGDIVHVPAGSAHATVPDDGIDMRLICFFPHPDLSANNVDTDIKVT
ncbi:MAG: cupin domain-containing protein [Acidimicrobiia bacterium]